MSPSGTGKGPAHLAIFALALGLAIFPGVSNAEVEELNPLSLTKYIDPLPVPGAMPMAGPNYYEIGAWQIQQQLHSQLPPTTVYGYGTTQANASYPGATIVAQKGVPIDIKWTNHLPMTHILDYAIDPTLPRAMTTTGIPIASHVHGAEVEPQSDGGPMTWFTAGFAEVGSDWTKQVLHYANNQLPATIWYHDHAFGYTRHNVYAGLAGFYVITDPGHEPAGLPAAPYDIGLALQDRMFTTDGQLWYPNEGETTIHPIWVPEFFGNVMLVNGKIWPYLEVQPRKYRFRFLNGAQARFFSLALADRVTSTPGPPFYQIGSDGGYLAQPVVLNEPFNAHSPRLVMGPGERADVIIDFSGYATGTEFLLKNTAKAPYPSGETPNPLTAGQLMLFRVVPMQGTDTSVIPAQLTTINRITNPTVTRVMTLNELMAEDAPIGALLNGTTMENGDETPTLGTTEMWEVVNMTGDAHPIHLHLVQFQLVNRQKINRARYERAFNEANPVLPTTSYTEVPVSGFLRGRPIPPDANELGWKDTFRMNPGEVTRIMIRFAPQDESPAFAFDATAEPGYVWHCHILEHEENDMMHTYHLVAPVPGAASLISAIVPGTTVPVAATNLYAPIPNPVAVAASLKFSLRTSGPVELDLYNVSGQHMKQLASGFYEAGDHSVPWRNTSEDGGRLANGTYFLRLRADGVVKTQKLILSR